MMIGASYWADCALSLILHEAAHVSTALALGLRVKRIGVSLKGPYIVRERGTPWENALVSLAGPSVNLLIALFYWDLAPQLALINLVLGAFNLLPIPHSDGRRAGAAIRAGIGATN
jgi:Zn-dependent protease